jgi:hypothetical protein
MFTVTWPDERDVEVHGLSEAALQHLRDALRSVFASTARVSSREVLPSNWRVAVPIFIDGLEIDQVITEDGRAARQVTIHWALHLEFANQSGPWHPMVGHSTGPALPPEPRHWKPALTGAIERMLGDAVEHLRLSGATHHVATQQPPSELAPFPPMMAAEPSDAAWSLAQEMYGILGRAGVPAERWREDAGAMDGFLALGIHPDVCRDAARRAAGRSEADASLRTIMAFGMRTALQVDACERGVASSCFAASVHYLRGDGTPEASLTAQAYRTKACRLGLARACSEAARP